MQRSVVLTVLGLALISLLVLLAWLVGQGFLGPGGDVQARGVESQNSPLTGRATQPETDKPSPDTGPGRSSLETPDARPKAPEVILTGRCVDEGAVPVAGAQVGLTMAEGTPSYALDLYRFQHPDMVWDDPPITVQSGGDGRFELRLRTPPVYRGWHLQICAEGCFPLHQYLDELTAGRHDLGDVVLRRGCLVSGAVRDGQGRPHGGVRLLFSRRVDWRKAVVEQSFLELHTAADGTFRATEPLAPTRWSVSLHGAQLPDDKPLALDLTGKASHDLQIRVRDFEDVDGISGCVVDEAGQPLVPAWVHFEPTGDYASTQWSKTDARGRFLVQRRQRDPEGKVTLIVTGEGRPMHRVPDVAWNTKDLRIVVPAPPGLELIVREAETGRPVEHYGVIHQTARSKGGFGHLEPLGHVKPHPEGRVVMTLTAGHHRFTVVPRDPDLAWSEPLDVEVGKDPVAPVVVALPTTGTRPVAVVDEAGQPVAGVRLQLLRPAFVGRKQRLSVIDPLQTGGASGPSLAVLEREVVSDAHGRQVLRGNPNHGHLLRVMPPSHLPQLLWDVIPAARYGELRIVLDRGCTVRATVKPMELWERFSSTRPAAGDDEEEPDIGFQVASRIPETQRRVSSLVLPDATGRFVISGMPPGAAELVMAWYRRDGEDLDRELTTVYRWPHLTAGRPVDVVIDLRRFQPVEVDGLATCNGRPLPDARITISVVQEVEGARKTVQGFQVKTDADGRFTCETLPGEWQASWFDRVGGASTDLVVRAGVVTPQTRTMVLAFQSGAVSLVLQRQEGAPVAGIVVSASPKGKAGRTRRLTRSDAQGRAARPHMPPGEYDLWIWPKSLASREARSKVLEDPSAARKARVHLGTIKVVMGETLERRITLPVAAGY